MQPNGGGGPTWWRPTTLDELLSLKEAEPGARIVVGASEIAIESRYKNHPAVSFLNAAAVPELKACEDTPEELIFGACAPLSDVEHLWGGGRSRPGHAGEAARAISDMLRWFASTQIRNVACFRRQPCYRLPYLRYDTYARRVQCDPHDPIQVGRYTHRTRLLLYTRLS